MGFRVWGLGFRVSRLVFRVSGLVFRVSGLGFRRAFGAVGFLSCQALGFREGKSSNREPQRSGT